MAALTGRCRATMFFYFDLNIFIDKYKFQYCNGDLIVSFGSAQKIGNSWRFFCAPILLVVREKLKYA
jgi:hypothetical protein